MECLRQQSSDHREPRISRLLRDGVHRVRCRPREPAGHHLRSPRGAFRCLPDGRLPHMLRAVAWDERSSGIDGGCVLSPHGSAEEEHAGLSGVRRKQRDVRRHARSPALLHCISARTRHVKDVAAMLIACEVRGCPFLLNAVLARRDWERKRLFGGQAARRLTKLSLCFEVAHEAVAPVSLASQWTHPYHKAKYLPTVPPTLPKLTQSWSLF